MARSLGGAVLGVALGLMGVSTAARPIEPDAWTRKVDPWVLSSAASGSAEFLVFLREQADLGVAAGLPSKAAEGELVRRTLRHTAARTQAPVLAALAALSAEARPFWIANMIWVRGDLTVARAMAERDDVLRVSANPSVRLQTLPPDPGPQREAPAGVEWGINRTNAPSVWALGFRGEGVVVAGQDTGYQWDHPALKAQYRGWNGSAADHNYNWHDAIHSGGGVCGANAPAPCDDNQHGTHTMGTMVGDDGGANQIGMAPHARWIGCRNMDQGAGTPATYAECFQWFVAPTDLAGTNPDPSKAPDVINNSWSCPPSEGCTDPLVLKTVVDNTRAAGIVVVVSAGNSGPSCSSVSSPTGIYDAAFTVGATDSSEAIASFSSRGPVTVDGSGRLKPDVSAPGVAVRSSVPGNAYGSKSGTSMAAPHVAGQVALLLSAMLPSWRGHVDWIEERIVRSAVPRTSTQSCGGVDGSQIPNHTFGWGRVDALAAVSMADLALTAQATPSPVCAGSALAFTLSLRSLGPGIATGITVTDTLPADLSGITTNGTGWTCNLVGSTLTCTLPSLASGASANPIVVTATVAPGASPRVNQATVTSTSTDGNAANNTASTSTPVVTPGFDGLASATAVAGTCGVRLEWVAARTCGGTPVVYNLYRSTDPGFTPDAGTRIATCVSNTTYTDTSMGVLGSATTFTYIVRSEDADLGHGGPCRGGTEDPNLVRRDLTLGPCGTPPSDVAGFTARAGDLSVKLEWVNPASGYGTTRVCWRTDQYPTGPTDPGASCATAAGTAGAYGSYTHGIASPGSITNGTTYFYAGYVNTAAGGGGAWSLGRFVTAMPFATTGKAKWAYSTGATALAPQAVRAGAAVYAVSNDRGFHAMKAGATGGAWPTGWKPFYMGGSAVSRPPVVTLTTSSIGGVKTVAFLGSLDGTVYAINALTGAILWQSPVLGEAVQASPSAMFTDFGGSYNVVLVGTRNSSGPNTFYGLNPADGSILWSFNNGGGANAIGIITGQAAVDYGTTPRRVIFTSHQHPTGSSSTVWSLTLTPTAPYRALSWQANIGDTDCGPVARGNAAYLGTNAGAVYALNKLTGASYWTGPYTTGDGPVKSFVWVDGATGRLYCSTNGFVHAIRDNGASTTPTAFWTTPVSLPNPSNPLLAAGKVYVGGGDGRVYEIIGTVASPPPAKSVPLGDLQVLGAPTLDGSTMLIHFGSESGRVYAVNIPF